MDRIHRVLGILLIALALGGASPLLASPCRVTGTITAPEEDREIRYEPSVAERRRPGQEGEVSVEVFLQGLGFLLTVLQALACYEDKAAFRHLYFLKRRGS